MIDKDMLRDRILKECDTCLHLYERVPEGGMDYRPTEGQRSTLELLRYLSFCAMSGCRAMAEGSWDSYEGLMKRAAEMGPEDFPAHMARQKEELTAFFDGLDQEALTTQQAKDPLGNEMTLGEALLALPYSWMVAYRMQLFLYAKQAGNADLWTPNCWAGVDWEKPTPKDVPDPEEVGSA